jgi:hypothetical protein
MTGGHDSDMSEGLRLGEVTDYAWSPKRTWYVKTKKHF